MEDNSYSFISIKNKKEYQQKRLQLVESMIAFLCYDKTQDNTEIIDFLEGIKENFGHKVDIILIEKNTIDENFRKDIFNEEPSPFFLICEPHNIDPTTVSLKNFDQFDLFKYFENKAKFYEKEFVELRQRIFDRIKKLLDSHPIVIFIKGTPFKPFCKYSKQFMDLIRPLRIRYKSFDIFTDDSLRTFLRLFSGWKTYPQIYINGKIIGGVDVLKGLIEKNEIQNVIPNECKYETVVNQTKDLIKKGLVVFGKVT